jgi:hypothetical protein
MKTTTLRPHLAVSASVALLWISGPDSAGLPVVTNG